MIINIESTVILRWSLFHILYIFQMHQMHPKAAKCTSMRLNAPECTWIHMNAPKSTQMHPNAPECTQMHPNAPEYTRMHPNALDMVQNHLKLYHKMTAVGVTAVRVTAVRNNLKFLMLINIGSTTILSLSLFEILYIFQSAHEICEGFCCHVLLVIFIQISECRECLWTLGMCVTTAWWCWSP